MTAPHPSRLRTAFFALGFASLGAIGTLGLTAAAGHGPGGDGSHGARGARVMMMAMERLDLTEAQQAALDQAKSDVVARVRDGRGDLSDDREEVLAALQDGSLSRAQLHDRVDARMAAAAEDMHYAIDRIMDVYETLDADQKAELSEMVQEFQARRAEHRDGRGGQGRGGMRGE